MLKPVAPSAELVEWLWSPEGLEWHAQNTHHVVFNRGLFAEVKYDHECDPEKCGVSRYSPYPDGYILADLKRYGIWGVPEEWKQR